MNAVIVGYIIIGIIVTICIILVGLILNDTIEFFNGDRDLYTPPKYRDLCTSNLYSRQSDITKPNYSDNKVYWNTDKLLKIHKNGDTYQRTCDLGKECVLTPKPGSTLLVYDVNNKSLGNSFNNELRNLKSTHQSNTLQYHMPFQPLKYDNLKDRNPIEPNAYDPSSQYFNKETGVNGYIVTEEECMDTCKDDCLGYFMIPNQFKSGQPYCLHLGVDLNQIKEGEKIKLDYSCTSDRFKNNALGNVYGRIKTNESPLLKKYTPKDGIDKYTNVKINLNKS